MYEEHPEFYPPSPDATLWRYMNFTKFVSLLDKESLFFSRVDKLGDPFEGSLSIINQSMRPHWLKSGGVDSNEIPKLLEAIPRNRKNTVSKLLVNCWHENNNESEAMWKLYGGDSGIAIKTTFKDLSNCFICDQAILIGKVRYIDYNTTPISEQNIFTPILNKRKSFEHEREVRAVLGEFTYQFEFGVYLEVDVKSLIHKVVVAPYSQDWFVDLVKSVSARYDLKAMVSKSDMEVTPIW